MTVTAVGEPVSRCHRGGFAVAILPGTAERDAPLVNSSHDQWDAAIALWRWPWVNPGDSPLDAVYAAINDDWTPADFLCVIDGQVVGVQQSRGHGDGARGRVAKLQRDQPGPYW